MSEPPRSVRIVSVLPLDDLHVRLDFDDGAERTIDLTPLLQSNEFKQIRLSEKYFRTAHLEGGHLIWDNGAMLDADLLRHGPPKPEKPKASKPAKHAAKAAHKTAKSKSKPAAKAPAKKVAKAIKPAKVKVKAKAKPAKKPVAKTRPTKKPTKPTKKKR